MYTTDILYEPTAGLTSPFFVNGRDACGLVIAGRDQLIHSVDIATYFAWSMSPRVPQGARATNTNHQHH